MDAVLLFADEYDIDERQRVELVAWQVPRPLLGSRHAYKYRLAFIVDGVCVLRYDNEAGKGDHRHLGAREFAYDFVDIHVLQTDFWYDVLKWRSR